MHKIVALPILVLFINFNAAGQEIPVDMNTGRPIITIPLWTITDHDLSDPVSLVYNADGVKLEESNGVCGVGWNIIAGGSISRVVRGLPDDYLGSSPDLRKGWFYNNIATNISNFSNTADLLAGGSCSDETTAYNALSLYNYTVDTEPDIFHYSVAGLQGSFVFDHDLNIRLIPYRDITITYETLSPTDKKITEFNITTSSGTVYSFSTIDHAWKSAYKYPSISSVEFLTTPFGFYDEGLTYNSAWKLTTTRSKSGACLNYKYRDHSYGSANEVSVGVRQSSNSELISKKIYRISESGKRHYLLSIESSSGEKITFGLHQEGRYMLKNVIVTDGRKSSSSKNIRRFDLEYKSVGNLTEIHKRIFLASVQEKSQCDKLPPYTFTYIGVDLENNISNLPMNDSYSKDFWGYYNGKPNTHGYPTLYVYPTHPSSSERFRLYPIPGYSGPSYVLEGADRTPDFNLMQTGSLETIAYPLGGITTLNYEPHDYTDPVTNQTHIGGGLRIRTIEYFDGVNTKGNIVKHFDYKDASGLSSGKLIRRPAFAIPTLEYRDPVGDAVRTYAVLSARPQQEMWEHLIVRSDKDLSQSSESSAIGYSKVKVSRPGAGSEEFEYDMPGSYGSTAGSVWVPTENKFVRSGTCSDMGIFNSGYLGEWAYPYSPNPNFDYERGFLTRQIERDEAGNKISETTYSPQYIYSSGASPKKVWGVAYERYANSPATVYFFGKYFLLADVAKVVSKQTSTTYDPGDENKKMTQTTDYFYESPNHRLLTKTRMTLSDGTIITNKTKYPLDYSVPSNVDGYLKAIKTLQDSSRNSTPIEVLTLQIKPGDVERVINSSLLKFSDFSQPGKVFPYQALSLKAGNGITDFVESDKLLQGSIYVFNQDQRYEVLTNYLAYDPYQQVVSFSGKDRIVKTISSGYQKTLAVAQAINAGYNEFAFSNFETDESTSNTGNEFVLSDQIYGTGRTGLNAIHPVVKLTKTVQKANVQNYRLSFWFKRSMDAVDFQIKLKDVTTSTVYFNSTFTVNAGSGEYEYFEKLIPVSTLPASFIVELQGVFTGTLPVSSPGLLPMIDDVTFAPENADLVTYTYDSPGKPGSITSVSGVTTYYDYDGLGREVNIWDHDKNLIKTNTYKFPSDIPQPFTAHIYGPTNVEDQTDIDFSANENTCIDNSVTKYEWDFGDGNGFQDLGPFVTHAFPLQDSVIVKLKKTHPLFGVTEYQKTVKIHPKGFDMGLCMKGMVRYSISGAVTTVYSSCSAITDTPDEGITLSKADDIGTSDPIQSYQWYIYDDDTKQWTKTGNDIQTSVDFQYWLNYAENYFNSSWNFDKVIFHVRVRCEIVTTTGRRSSSTVGIAILR